MNLPPFPTMLRKMWSATEIQEWINENKPKWLALADAPVGREVIVLVSTDAGFDTSMMHKNDKGNWLLNEEETYSLPYFIMPIAWMEKPEIPSDTACQVYKKLAEEE